MIVRFLLVFWLVGLAATQAQVPSPDTLGSVIILKFTPLALFDLDLSLIHI